MTSRDATALAARRLVGPALIVEQPWRSAKPLFRLRIALLLPVLLFAFSLYQNLGNMDTVDFHRDEARWINRAHFLGDLVDPFGDSWSDYYTTRGQPPLGNYLMGAGLLIQGRDLETNRVWDFSYDEAWNMSVGASPEPADLNAGRRTNAVVGALVVVGVYAVTSRLTNRFGGFMAGFFLSSHPLHLRLSSQALSDELLALTIVLSFLAAFRLARNQSLGSGLLLGALLGLGGAAKLSPLLISLPLAAYGGLWLVTRLWREGRPGVAWNRARFGWLLAMQPAIAFATFVAVNPYLWPNPIERGLNQFNFRLTEMDLQSSAWPIAGVGGPMAALMRTGRRFDQDYSSSLRVQAWFENLVSAQFRHVSLDVVPMAAGVVVLIAIVVRNGLWSPHALTAFLMAGQSAAVIVGMGVDFYRYFLPLLVVGAICVGVAAGAGFEAVRGWRKPRVSPVEGGRDPHKVQSRRKWSPGSGRNSGRHRALTPRGNVST
ncbi:MAG: phospholipid carrier-dependent glycosyltransferase [Chloroflexia bacterium]|nr:phospholipid carrier-dependent glycosyltransferase [Chloroflexia bacterium]